MNATLNMSYIFKNSIVRATLQISAMTFLGVSLQITSLSSFAADYVNPNDCGGDGQPACYISAAKKIKNANPGGGAFFDLYDGGGWWSCEGWKRTWSAINASDACVEKGLFSPTRKAKLIYKYKDMEKDGNFLDIVKQEWWSCPSGFTRNANPVDKGEACSATVGKACDSGLVDVRDSTREFSWQGGGYTCYKKGQCGAEGQRPCQLAVDGIQRSCKDGLEEDFVKNECRIGVFGDIEDLDKDFASFFLNTWQGRAIVDQMELSLDVPLAYATMIGSHNSYNSKAYDYIDPNQYLTLLDQLRGGAHFIELDVHDRDDSDVVLCHSKHETGGMGGCGSGDRLLTEGLDELRVFLEDAAFKQRIFIIYLENFSTDTAAVYEAIQDKIGSYVYKSGGCKSIPAKTLTAQHILDAGKRVLIWNGSEVEPECSDNVGFKNMVFTGLGWDGRTWEDEPMFTDLEKLKNKWTPAMVVEEIEKGKNLANHDFLYINDVYKAMAWSWNTDEPNDVGNEDCAVQTTTKRLGKGEVWNDVPCGTENIAYACENSSGDWKATSNQNTGQWSQGDEMCSKEFGSGYFFSVPVSAAENVKLTNAKQASSSAGKSIWLNYNDQAKEGTWVGRHRWNNWTCSSNASCWQNVSSQLLATDTMLTSRDGKTSVVMQNDCNLVIYSNGKPTWASQTYDQGTGCQLAFQSDGNLVIYKPGGVPVWATDTDGKGADLTLQMQNNGNLVMHDAERNVIWRSMQ
jgi:hypothetical protein